VYVEVTVNGQPERVQVDPGMTLLGLLRDRLGLTGTKEGCGVGECGACTVLLDGVPVNSCLVLAAEVNGREVKTIESEAAEGQLSALQEAFITEDAVQCGFCTPGMVLSARGLLLRNPDPSEEEIRAALAGNLCRCTGYDAIVAAVRRAAAALRKEKE